MQDVKTALEDFGIDGNEILNLLKDEKIFDAIRIFEQKTPLNSATIMSLLSSIEKGAQQFEIFPKGKASDFAVRYSNSEGQISILMSEDGGEETVVTPNDREWSKVKQVLGDKPEFIEYEKAFLENERDHPNKSALFIKESRFSKGNIILILAALVIIAYFIYQKN